MSVAAGVEYFFVSEISIAAEYSFGITLRGQHREFRNFDRNATTEEGPGTFHFGTQAAVVILHCYF